MFLPHCILVPLDACLPVVRKNRVAISIDEVAGAEEADAATDIPPHGAEAPLLDVIGVEVCHGRVATVGIDSKFLGQLAQDVHVPSVLDPVLINIWLAVVRRRIGQTGFIE